MIFLAMIFAGKRVWSNLNNLKIENKVKEFQWKCLHNIIYTESRLKKMNKSNGQCHFCLDNDSEETLQHLFFQCEVSSIIVQKINNILQILNISVNVNIGEREMMLGIVALDNSVSLVNILIFYTKWYLWKIRNTIKYNKLKLSRQAIVNIWRKDLTANLRFIHKLKINTTDDRLNLSVIIDHL